LDTALVSYKNHALGVSHVVFLSSLIVILIQSFSLFLKVSTNPTYSGALHESIRRRFRIPVLFGSMIIVFVLLYLLAEFFSGDAVTFLVGSLFLAFSWLLFDYICKSTIADYYISQQRSDQIEKDPLYVAVGLWMVCDIVLVILSTILIISVWKAKVSEFEAACMMLFGFSLLSYLVLQSVQKMTSN